MNGINYPIKICRLGGWIEKQDPNVCCLQETHPPDKGENTDIENIDDILNEIQR